MAFARERKSVMARISDDGSVLACHKQIAPLDTGFLQRVAEIVSDVEIDMDAPLSPDDE